MRRYDRQEKEANTLWNTDYVYGSRSRATGSSGVNGSAGEQPLIDGPPPARMGSRSGSLCRAVVLT